MRRKLRWRVRRNTRLDTEIAEPGIARSDACGRAIQCLAHTATPPRILNITGPEKLSVREVALEFGRRFNKTPSIIGEEAPTAWLADASESVRLMGQPETSVSRMMEMITRYINEGGRLLGKPTHFEARTGQF